MKPSNATSTTHLLGTDRQQSVLRGFISPAQHQGYSPYGFSSSRHSALAFNGERPDSLTGHYHLGNGYRAFNVVLMRFNQPDNLSPFSSGGLNTYGYCAGDPVNRRDPTGHWSWRSIGQWFRRGDTQQAAPVANANITASAPHRAASIPPRSAPIDIPQGGRPHAYQSRVIEVPPVSRPRGVIATEISSIGSTPTQPKEGLRQYVYGDFIRMKSELPEPVTYLSEWRLARRIIRQNMASYRDNHGFISGPDETEYLFVHGWAASQDDLVAMFYSTYDGNRIIRGAPSPHR